MTFQIPSFLEFLRIKVLPFLAIVLACLGMLTMVVSAQTAARVDCATAAQKGLNSNIGDLFQPTKFLPLVPDECALDDKKNPRSLSLNIFGYTIMRLYFFISSLAFFLFSLSIIYFGFQQIASGVTGTNQYTFMQGIKRSVTGLVMVTGAYLIVSVVAQILGISDFLSKPLTDAFTDTGGSTGAPTR